MTRGCRSSGSFFSERLGLGGDVDRFRFGLLLVFLLRPPPGVGARQATQRHAQGHEEGAEQDRVGESLHGSARVAVRVEAGEAGKENLPALVNGLGRFREQIGEKPVAMQRHEGLACATLAEDLVDLLEDARGAAAHDLAAQVPDRLLGVPIDGEVEPRGQCHRAQHSCGVLPEADDGIADRTDDPVAEVVQARHPIDDREGRDVVEERVHGEVAAEGVLLGGAEGVVAADEGVALLRLGLAAEGRDLDHLATEAHVAQPEAPAHDEAVAEQALHLGRVGRRADVEVLGLAPEQEVAHSSAHEERHEPSFFRR